jgi:hypothetical protein
MEEEIKLAKGFDRDIDYMDIKERLIKSYNDMYRQIKSLMKKDNINQATLRNMKRKFIYITIALIQLRSGSRIIEAVKAFNLFMKNKNTSKNVIVKLAKSETTKYKDGESYVTKPRYREMKFPEKWIKLHLRKSIRSYSKDIGDNKLKKGVLDYLLNNHSCNTHSLRYAYINYMLYTKKVEIGLLCKIIGHSNTNQIVRYTQTKNASSIFDEDI